MLMFSQLGIIFQESGFNENCTGLNSEFVKPEMRETGISVPEREVPGFSSTNPVFFPFISSLLQNQTLFNFLIDSVNNCMSEAKSKITVFMHISHFSEQWVALTYKYYRV
ncbi:hypothetical protein PAMP_024265 [Pampus punctatissimus]